MARLWSCGFELQPVASGMEFSAIIGTPGIETTTKRSGAASLRITAAGAEGFRHAHSTAQGEFYLRFYIYIVTLPAVTGVIGGWRQTGNNKVTIRLTTTGALQLYNSEDGAQVGSDSSLLSTATWYRIEVMYDSTTLATTAVEANAYADTPGAASFWNPSGTIDLAATPNSGGAFHAGDTALDYIVDDCAINDTSGSFQNSWPGEGEIICLRPNAAGDNADWTRGGADSGANWSQCDEITPNDATDYVQSNTSGQIDDYNLDATPAAMDSTDVINVVHVGTRAAVDDATSSDPDIVLRIKASASGTVEESASLDCNSLTWQSPAPAPATQNYVLTLYDLPGASTTAWTKADLDTAQAGIREAVTDTNFARVSAVWVMVDHKPGVAPPAGANVNLLSGKFEMKLAGKL